MDVISAHPDRGVTFVFTGRNFTTADSEGNLTIELERNTDEQMAVSVLHELRHAADYMEATNNLDIMALRGSLRHEEVYRLSNQVLYDLTGKVDTGGGHGFVVNNARKYTLPCLPKKQ